MADIYLNASRQVAYMYGETFQLVFYNFFCFCGFNNLHVFDDILYLHFDCLVTNQND